MFPHVQQGTEGVRRRKLELSKINLVTGLLQVAYGKKDVRPGLYPSKAVRYYSRFSCASDSSWLPAERGEAQGSHTYAPASGPGFTSMDTPSTKTDHTFCDGQLGGFAFKRKAKM